MPRKTVQHPDPARIRNALMILLNIAEKRFTREARDATDIIVDEIAKLER